MLAVDFRAYRRLLREKRGAGDPAGACAEEAPGLPAESEDMRGIQLWRLKYSMSKVIYKKA